MSIALFWSSCTHLVIKTNIAGPRFPRVQPPRGRRRPTRRPRLRYLCRSAIKGIACALQGLLKATLFCWSLLLVILLQEASLAKHYVLGEFASKESFFHWSAHQRRPDKHCLCLHIRGKEEPLFHGTTNGPRLPLNMHGKMYTLLLGPHNLFVTSSRKEESSNFIQAVHVVSRSCSLIFSSSESLHFVNEVQHCLPASNYYLAILKCRRILFSTVPNVGKEGPDPTLTVTDKTWQEQLWDMFKEPPPNSSATMLLSRLAQLDR